MAILDDNNEQIIFVEMDGLRRDDPNSRFSWDGKIEHYEDLVSQKKIDGYLNSRSL